MAVIEGSCNQVQGEMMSQLSTPFEALFHRNYLLKYCLVGTLLGNVFKIQDEVTML